MAARFKPGPFRFYTKSGHVLTFTGDLRFSYTSAGYVEDYHTRGGAEWFLLPALTECDAIEQVQDAA